MQEELLNIIKCPGCGSHKRENFNLIKEEVDSFEIREGMVICNSCRVAFRVKNGILNLLYKPAKEIIAEVEGNIKAAQAGREEYSDEALLLLPESAESKIPLDSTYACSLNFYKALEELKMNGKELVLDLGSGNTWSARKLAQRGLKCVALDISSVKFKGLESADVYFRHDKVYYDRVIADMKNLPFINGSFDAVVSNSSIHHATDLRLTLKEISRVLKGEAKLALINEAVCGVFSIKRDISRKNIPNFAKDFHWTENTYSINQYLRYIKMAGFKNPKVIYPPSLEKNLQNASKIKIQRYNKGIKHLLAYFISFFWRNNLFFKVARKLGFWLIMVLLGLPLILIAKKNINQSDKEYLHGL
jgi:ubiquinone/menaquinone biosynthesis C-methylase UbiE/uncharacterized protein YbaR (Trm112 family)